MRYLSKINFLKQFLKSSQKIVFFSAYVRLLFFVEVFFVFKSWQKKKKNVNENENYKKKRKQKNKSHTLSENTLLLQVRFK